MTTERDASSDTGLVRRATQTLGVALSTDSPVADRRKALLKTIGVSSAVVVAAVAGADGVAHDPGVLNILSSPTLAPAEWTAGAGLGIGGFVLGMIALVEHGIDADDRRGLHRFFHGTRTVGYIGATTLGVAAAVCGLAGAGHVLPDATSVTDALIGTASGIAGLGAGAHVLERIVRPRPQRIALSE